MRLLNYILTMFWKKSPVQERKIEVVRRESTSLRLDEWRSQPELVALADAVWRNHDFRLMLQVVQTESPGNFAVLSGDLETRALHQARSEGYNLALAHLKALRISVNTVPELEATYEAEEN